MPSADVKCVHVTNSFYTQSRDCMGGFIWGSSLKLGFLVPGDVTQGPPGAPYSRSSPCFLPGSLCWWKRSLVFFQVADLRVFHSTEAVVGPGSNFDKVSRPPQHLHLRPSSRLEQKTHFWGSTSEQSEGPGGLVRCGALGLRESRQIGIIRDNSWFSWRPDTVRMNGCWSQAKVQNEAKGFLYFFSSRRKLETLRGANTSRPHLGRRSGVAVVGKSISRLKAGDVPGPSL